MSRAYFLDAHFFAVLRQSNPVVHCRRTTSEDLEINFSFCFFLHPEIVVFVFPNAGAYHGEEISGKDGEKSFEQGLELRTSKGPIFLGLATADDLCMNGKKQNKKNKEEKKHRTTDKSSVSFSTLVVFFVQCNFQRWFPPSLALCCYSLIAVLFVLLF